MGTKITTLMLCLVLSLSAIAQQKTDSFFNYQDVDRAIITTPVEFHIQDGIVIDNMNVNAAPVGSGLLILTMVSMLYFMMKKKGC